MFSAVSRRDLSNELTWGAHRRITEFCRKVKTPPNVSWVSQTPTRWHNFRHNSAFCAPVICMGAIYLYDWCSRYAPSHLYEGIICGIEKSIIPISIGIWWETQPAQWHGARIVSILLQYNMGWYCSSNSYQNQYSLLGSAVGYVNPAAPFHCSVLTRCA